MSPEPTPTSVTSGRGRGFSASWRRPPQPTNSTNHEDDENVATLRVSRSRALRTTARASDESLDALERVEGCALEQAYEPFGGRLGRRRRGRGFRTTPYHPENALRRRPDSGALFNAATSAVGATAATVDTWRQARIDLADFAGQSNLKLRFDFSTHRSMDWANQSSLVDPSGNPLPGSDDANFTNGHGYTNNRHQGFFVDDIIVGLAERGELVTGSTTGASTASPPFLMCLRIRVPRRTQESLTGPYQLEIRRGSTAGGPVSLTADGIVINNPYDSNARLNNSQIITDDFSSGSFSALPSISTSTGTGGTWNVTTTAPLPRYSAQAGSISASETSTLSLTLDTLSGPGQTVRIRSQPVFDDGRHGTRFDAIPD